MKNIAVRKYADGGEDFRPWSKGNNSKRNRKAGGQASGKLVKARPTVPVGREEEEAIKELSADLGIVGKGNSPRGRGFKAPGALRGEKFAAQKGCAIAGSPHSSPLSSSSLIRPLISPLTCVKMRRNNPKAIDE
eukprot:2798565-Rhodomonas_salina.1